MSHPQKNQKSDSTSSSSSTATAIPSGETPMPSSAVTGTNSTAGFTGNHSTDPKASAFFDTLNALSRQISNSSQSQAQSSPSNTHSHSQQPSQGPPASSSSSYRPNPPYANPNTASSAVTTAQGRTLSSPASSAQPGRSSHHPYILGDPYILGGHHHAAGAAATATSSRHSTPVHSLPNSTNTSPLHPASTGYHPNTQYPFPSAQPGSAYNFHQNQNHSQSQAAGAALGDGISNLAISGSTSHLQSSHSDPNDDGKGKGQGNNNGHGTNPQSRTDSNMAANVTTAWPAMSCGSQPLNPSFLANNPTPHSPQRSHPGGMRGAANMDVDLPSAYNAMYTHNPYQQAASSSILGLQRPTYNGNGDGAASGSGPSNNINAANMNMAGSSSGPRSNISLPSSRRSSRDLDGLAMADASQHPRRISDSETLPTAAGDLNGFNPNPNPQAGPSAAAPGMMNAPWFSAPNHPQQPQQQQQHQGGPQRRSSGMAPNHSNLNTSSMATNSNNNGMFDFGHAQPQFDMMSSGSSVADGNSSMPSTPMMPIHRTISDPHRGGPAPAPLLQHSSTGNLRKMSIPNTNSSVGGGRGSTASSIADQTSLTTSPTNSIHLPLSRTSTPPTRARSRSHSNAAASSAVPGNVDVSMLSLKSESNEDEKVDHRKRKRNRTIQSCLPCHQNKRKCDRKRPCSRCTALGLTGSCVYEVDHPRNTDDPEETENEHLRSRIAELEQVVRELRQRGSSKAGTGTGASTPLQGSPPPGNASEPAEKKRRLIVDRFARFKLDEAHHGLLARTAMENAMAAEREHRSGSQNGNDTDEEHPDGKRKGSNHSEEPYLPSDSIMPGEELVGDAQGRETYVGVPGGRSMLRRLAEITASSAAHDDDDDLFEIPEDVAFTGFFPDMRKTFPFTTIWSHENFVGEIIGLLPTQQQSKYLWASFAEEVSLFFSGWHLPDLKEEYDAFFAASQEEKTAAPLGSLSVYLMICALGIMMRASQKEIFGQTRHGEVDREEEKTDLTCSRLQSEIYLSGAYQALRLCSFLSAPTLATVTAQVLIGIYLLNSERASDFWPSLGSLIRQAIAIGLHIDPSRLYPGISLKDAEVRRRLWWTIAGLDALLCLSLGRPSAINYYNTQLPRDLPDELFRPDGSHPYEEAAPPGETTSDTFHAAYYALTLPSFEILSRVFPVDRNLSQFDTRGWFKVQDDGSQTTLGVDASAPSTYEDAIRLDKDIVTWYNLIPAGMHFDPDRDTGEVLAREREYSRINQTLALTVKVNMVRLILHRPYLRADPDAYPLSSEICHNAAYTILRAYAAMHATGCSIIWSWWTMSLRAFHAAAVCAFLAIRQPNSAIADQCLRDIRSAIGILEGRLQSWMKTHPVQGHLCSGLQSLEKLATAATMRARDQEASRAAAATSKQQFLSPPKPQNKFLNLSSVQAFPQLGSLPPSPGIFPGGQYFGDPAYNFGINQMQGLRPSTAGSMADRPPSRGAVSALTAPFSPSLMNSFGGPQNANQPNDAMALPQFWAEVFGIPVNSEGSSNPLLQLG